jgi:Dolichyl-phosphate-mannose-protein mannosyltransferase
MASSKTKLDSTAAGLEHDVNRRMDPALASKPLPWSRSEMAFILVASILFLVLSIGSIRMESVTTNEVLYIPAGLSYLERLDARMDIEHPPLIKAIAGLPVLLLHGKADYSDPIWTAGRGGTSAEYAFGEKFFESWNANQQTLVFAARLPMIALTLLLGLSLYVMARELTGPWGAALTLILFVTSPFFLANGPLVMTDVPVALFSVWTMWFFASLWQEPTRRNALLFATSLVGALLSKFSGVFLFPAIFLCWVWFRFSDRLLRVHEASGISPDAFRRERLAIGAIMLAGVVVFLFYVAIFHRSAPLAILTDEVNEIQAIGGHIVLLYSSISIMTKHPGLEQILLPLWLYVGGLGHVVGHGSRPMYFLGRWHPHGVWYYFPVISFFKLAPGMIALFLLLSALAAASFLRRTGDTSIVPNSKRPHLRAMLVTLAVFALIAMASNLNVGIRHFSVPITLAVLLSSLIIPLTRSVLGSKVQPIAYGAIAVLALSCLVTAFLTYPHYLAYYNVFRLNLPKQEISINSNLSLGQSMEELAAFFKQQHASGPYVDTRTSVLDPAVYIPGAHPWQCDKPSPVTPEWVAVTTVAMIHQPPNCEYLMRYPSWNIGDGAVMAFHLTGRKTAP